MVASVVKAQQIEANQEQGIAKLRDGTRSPRYALVAPVSDVRYPVKQARDAVRCLGFSVRRVQTVRPGSNPDVATQ